MARAVRMERRHFELIAETIRFMEIAPEAREAVAAEFAKALRRTNERFAEERFIEACRPAARLAKAAE